VNGQLNIEEIRTYRYVEAFQALKQIHGIGEKVANCICLYGLHHIEVFPIDVWIKRILEEVYQNEFDLQLYEGHAGIIQQYMFYYMRNKE
jgi:N-glycosylase/DNA lyase